MNASVLQGLGFCVVGICFFIESLSIRSLGYDALDSPFFPKLSAALLIVFGAMLAITSSSLFKKGEKLKDEKKEESSLQSRIKIMTFIFMLVIYAAVMKQVGFVLTTISFVIASYLIMTKKKGVKEIVCGIMFACLSTFAFWYIFEKGLQVMLP